MMEHPVLVNRKFIVGFGSLGLHYDRNGKVPESYYDNLSRLGVNYVRQFLTSHDAIRDKIFEMPFKERVLESAQFQRKYDLYPMLVPMYDHGNDYATYNDVKQILETFVPIFLLAGFKKKEILCSPGNERVKPMPGIGIKKDIGNGRYLYYPGSSNYLSPKSGITYVNFVDDNAWPNLNTASQLTLNRRLLAAYYFAISRWLETNYGIPLSNIIGNVRNDWQSDGSAGPHQTTDPIISGLSGLWFGEDRRKEVTLEYHKILTVGSIFHNNGTGGLLKRQNMIKNVIFSEDGSDVVGASGKWLIINGKKRFRRATAKERKDKNDTLFLISRVGKQVKDLSMFEELTPKDFFEYRNRQSLKVFVELFDFGRFADTTSATPDEWGMDFSKTDFEGMRDSLPTEYKAIHRLNKPFVDMNASDDPIVEEPIPNEPPGEEEEMSQIRYFNPMRYLIPTFEFKPKFKVKVHFKGFFQRAKFVDYVFTLFSILGIWQTVEIFYALLF